ncbi:hypothetical protein WJX72_001219 [[Myrmecia] bisecta]|uniref:Peroxiredoxin n=1 Tax=[Myrmecia] bisecta TaxID=41462 RepID=A0AAW1P7E8_9CHLO
MGPPNLGDTVPNFKAESTQGPLEWHKYIDGSWAVLFSHPADYTPVCTTELGTVAKYAQKFKDRGVKLAALSCNDTASHKGWITDIEATKFSDGAKVDYPIIADESRNIATTWGMIDPDEKSATGLPMTARAVFVIGPDKKLKLSILYPATTGRNFDEILRVIDSLQLTAKHSVATPANWHHGEKCMVVPTLSDEDAKAKLGGFDLVGVPSGKRYIRLTNDPSSNNNT